MQRLGSWTSFLSVTVLLGAAAYIVQGGSQNEKLPPHSELVSLPMQVGEWHGQDMPLPQSTFEVLGPGSFLSREYLRSTPDPPVSLFIAFFPSQRTGDTIHSPKNCLPGAGWVPLESGHISIRRQGGSSLLVNRYLIGKGSDREIVLYWYQSHGRVTPSEYWAKIFLVTDAIRLNRTDGALVRVMTPLMDKEDYESAQTRTIAFTEGLIPLLDAYVPR